MSNRRGWSAYLRALMDSRGWKPVDLARRSGIKQGVISRWLRDEEAPTPSIPNLRRIAEVTYVRLVDLLVVAGHLTPEEAGMDQAPEPPRPIRVEELVDEDESLTPEAREMIKTWTADLRRALGHEAASETVGETRTG